MRVAVYVRQEDARSLAAEGKDPGQWVRDLVKYALEKRRAKVTSLGEIKEVKREH